MSTKWSVLAWIKMNNRLHFEWFFVGMKKMCTPSCTSYPIRRCKLSSRYFHNPNVHKYHKHSGHIRWYFAYYYAMLQHHEYALAAQRLITQPTENSTKVPLCLYSVSVNDCDTLANTLWSVWSVTVRRTAWHTIRCLSVCLCMC